MFMAIDEQLPPACAFAVSVLEERDLDPDSVPEEAVEAAQHHMATCPRCLNAAAISTPRKKKKMRRVAEPDYAGDQVQDSRATARVAPTIYEDTSLAYGRGEYAGHLQASPVQFAAQTQ